MVPSGETLRPTHPGGIVWPSPPAEAWSQRLHGAPLDGMLGERFGPGVASGGMAARRLLWMDWRGVSG